MQWQLDAPAGERGGVRAVAHSAMVVRSRVLSERKSIEQ